MSQATSLAKAITELQEVQNHAAVVRALLRGSIPVHEQILINGIISEALALEDHIRDLHKKAIHLS